MRQLTSQRQVPLDILGAATAYRLGVPEKVFDPRQEQFAFRLIGFVSLFLGCLIILIFLVAFEQLFSWWVLWQALLIPLVGLAWLIFGGWVLLAPHLYPQPHVYVCPEGLIVSADRIEVVRWDQMERLWRESDGRANGRRRYIVRRSDEALIPFGNDLKDVERLGALIEQEITRRLLPRALAAYRAGASVSFDEIVVSKRGLELCGSKQDISWQHFGSLEIGAQFILIRLPQARGLVARIKTASVPNARILSQLVDYAYREHVLSCKPHIVAYASGVPLSFGKLRIGQQGVRIEQGEPVILAWEEIGAIGIGPREVMIARGRDRHTREWYVLPLWEIANLNQLRDVVEYVLQSATI